MLALSRIPLAQACRPLPTRPGRVWLAGWALRTLLAGCALYHPLPLDETARAEALAPLQLDRVKVAAAALEHPLVKPIVIDGAGGFSAVKESRRSPSA